MKKCIDCGDTGSYITPWSDAADASPALKALVLDYPVEPDGTVLIRCTHCPVDPPNWVSVRLREAGNILAGAESKRLDGHLSRVMFALADRAEFMERHDIKPLHESNWGMVFSNAVIFAAGVVEEFNDPA